jgi:hypothetical protein
MGTPPGRHPHDFHEVLRTLGRPQEVAAGKMSA